MIATRQPSCHVQEEEEEHITFPFIFFDLILYLPQFHSEKDIETTSLTIFVFPRRHFCFYSLLSSNQQTSHHPQYLMSSYSHFILLSDEPISPFYDHAFFLLFYREGEGEIETTFNRDVEDDGMALREVSA